MLTISKEYRINAEYYLEIETPNQRLGVLSINSLTMTYFHTGTRTIIGAESFHFPVRDGKEWYQLAMVIRRNWVLPRSMDLHACVAANS